MTKRQSSEEFLSKAIAVHGDKYDYSQVNYVNYASKIQIICSDHGVFFQTPSNHLHGFGCIKCGQVMKRQTNVGFISKAISKHGNKYDYSQTNYVNKTTKIKIICPKHGEFLQTPSNHLSGFGCLKCGYGNAGQYHKKNTQSFITEARKKHGDTYDYSKTIYKGAREKLIIICHEHGEFEQVAYSHLSVKPSEACLKCSYKNRGSRNLQTYDEFLKKATDTHHDRYDYSKVKSEFSGANSSISIICPKHGEFKQLPINHLLGMGCKICGAERTAQSQLKSTDEFILGAQKIHGNLYDYSKVDYKGAFENVSIVCRIDGIFKQSPTSHLAGIGCPRCSRRAQGAPRNLVRAVRGEFDDQKPSFVYIIRFLLPNSKQPLFKVGTGSGSRLSTTIASIKRIGGIVKDSQKIDLPSTGEAIVFEHLAHQQIMHSQFPILPELKFPGHSEVFTQRPDFDLVENHEILKRFRTSERWVIKRSGKGKWLNITI